jgi:hypothetical protein
MRLETGSCSENSSKTYNVPTYERKYTVDVALHQQALAGMGLITMPKMNARNISDI